MVFYSFKNTKQIKHLLAGLSQRTSCCFDPKIDAILSEGGNIMTRNQIEYSKLLETHRANTEMEAQTRLRDRRNHMVALRSAHEVERHNRATEGAAVASLAEQKRANIARESLSQGQLAETIRANRNSESLRAVQNSIAAQQAETASAAQRETARANRASEQLRREQTSLDYSARMAQVAASRYATDVAASTAAHQLEETVRSNKRREGFQLAQTVNQAVAQTENKRSNIARETETNRSNVAREEETKRSHLASETETKRHNKVTETFNYVQLGARTATDLAGMSVDLTKEGMRSVTTLASRLINLKGDRK